MPAGQPQRAGTKWWQPCPALGRVLEKAADHKTPISLPLGGAAVWSNGNLFLTGASSPTPWPISLPVVAQDKFLSVRRRKQRKLHLLSPTGDELTPGYGPSTLMVLF